MIKRLAIDISRWQRVLDSQSLKSSGVDCVIVKCSQGSVEQELFKEHSANAVEAGMILGAYHWLDPFVNVDKQVDTILRVTENVPVDFFCIDLEQYGTTYKNLYPRKSPQALSDICKDIYMKLLVRLGGETDVLIYTRSTFVDAYAKPVVSWIDSMNVPTWIASYPFHPPKPITVEWGDFIEHYVPSQFLPYYMPSTTPLEDNTQIWQFTGDRFLMPYVYGDDAGTINSPLDINLMTEDFFQKYKKDDTVIQDPIEEPTPTPEPPIVVIVPEQQPIRYMMNYNMKLRSIPSLIYTSERGRLFRGSVIPFNDKLVEAEGYVWRQNLCGHWIAEKPIGSDKLYMTKID